MMQRPKSILANIVIFVLAVLLSPLIVAGFVAYGIYTALLYLTIWAVWCRNGPRVFISYSRSPHWQERFENVLIPQLPSSSIIVNWSDRKTWPRFSLRTLAFEHYLGNIAHTPSVIVFKPLRRAQVFRFFEAYKIFKHGNDVPVLELESALLNAVGSNNSFKPKPLRGSA
jgi:hypothetical protein